MIVLIRRRLRTLLFSPRTSFKLVISVFLASIFCLLITPDMFLEAKEKQSGELSETIKSSISNHFVLPAMLLDFAKAAGFTLFMSLVFWGMQKLFHLFYEKSKAFASNRVRTIHIGGRDLVQAEQINLIISRCVVLFNLLLRLTLFLFYFNTVLSFFPLTRSISIGVFASITSVFSQLFWSFVSYAPNLIFLIILGFLAFYLLRFVEFLFSEVDRGTLSLPGFEQDWARPTARITQVLVVALAAMVAYPYLPGSGTGVFQGISIFLGILISLGSSSVISNVIAGILLTYTKEFRIGDKVQILDVTGVIVEKGLLVTRLLTLKNYFVSIPNAQVIGSNVTNFRSDGQKDGDPHLPPIVYIEIGFSHDVPWQKVYNVLLKAARETEHVLQEPVPWIVLNALNDSCAVYELNVYTNNPQESLLICSQLRQRIQENCYIEGLVVQK